MVVLGVQRQPKIEENSLGLKGCDLLADSGSTANSLCSSGARKSYLNTRSSVSFPLFQDHYGEAHTWNSFFANLSSSNFPLILSASRKSKMLHKTNKFNNTLNFKTKKFFL